MFLKGAKKPFAAIKLLTKHVKLLTIPSESSKCELIALSQSERHKASETLLTG